MSNYPECVHCGENHSVSYCPDCGACDYHGSCWNCEPQCDPHSGTCANDNEECKECSDYWLEFHAEALMEDRWLYADNE